MENTSPMLIAPNSTHVKQTRQMKVDSDIPSRAVLISFENILDHTANSSPTCPPLYSYFFQPSVLCSSNFLTLFLTIYSSLSFSPLFLPFSLTLSPPRIIPLLSYKSPFNHTLLSLSLHPFSSSIKSQIRSHLH